MTSKKPFFANHAKSSAMIASLVIHAILAAIAVTFVVVSVMPKEEAPFVPKKVARPKMPPKQIKVPVDTKKRKPKPRLRQRIVTDRKTLTDIQLPEISGVKGGLGNMGGTGNWNLGFDIKMDLFGGDRAMGNELVGTFYDLKQTKNGKPSDVGVKYAEYINGANAAPMIDAFFGELARFASGWNPNRLKEYYQAPKKKYGSFFMIPTIPSSEATKAFGVADTVSAGCWAAYYTGHIAAPETGEYRFWGYGDDVLMVRVKKRLVLDAGFAPFRPKLGTGWDSRDDDNNRIFPINLNPNRPNENLLYTGDWIKLNKGEPVMIEILIADVGGQSSAETCACYLLIEKKGETYKQASYSYKKSDGSVQSGTRPVLPVFKLAEIPSELHSKMKINPNEATLQGPTFGAAVAE